MVDKELIENWRNMVKPPISSLLFKTNYEGRGEQDKEEFERDFDEILDLALIGLKHKEQFSQEDATKDATSDTISRQAAIDSLDCINGAEEVLRALPPAQPERKTGYWIPVTHSRGGHECNRCHDYAPSYQNGDEYLANYCPNCGAYMKGATFT